MIDLIHGSLLTAQQQNLNKGLNDWVQPKLIRAEKDTLKMAFQ